MPRAAFPSGRKSLILLVLAVLIAVAWWWQRPPPDPVSNGQRLSEFIFVPRFQFMRDPQVARKKLRSFGPAGVAWLAYQVEERSGSFVKNGPLPFDRAPDWLRRWVPERWGGQSRHSEVHERLSAAFALAEFGPEAAPAIPGMARCLQTKREDMIQSAAMVLNCVGPASWPVVHEALQYGSISARSALLGGMYQRLMDRDTPVPDSEVALVVKALVQGCRDPDSRVRFAALQSMAFSLNARPSTVLFDAAVSEAIRLLTDADPMVRDAAAFAIGKFGRKGAVATPHLIALLDDSSSKIRYTAALALSAVDKLEQSSAPRLRVMLLHDPDAGCRKCAADALTAFGVSSDDGNAAGSDSLAR